MNKTKIITITILIISSFIISCSNDNDETTNNIYLNIPDIHFETKLIAQGIDSDGVINQKMLKSDAENLTRLDLNLIDNSGEITDLTGIEGFVNITFLSVAQQKIEDINLSFNTKLDSLYLPGNYISSLDVSQNTNLILLDVQSNLLSSINGLDNATLLKDLDLSWNYFESITVTNELLEVLHMSHNDLKYLNTDGLVHLAHVFMPSNKLEIVDFSTNILLETLLLAGNKIDTINLENNSILTHLYISSNALTNLDVSNNNELLDLRVDRNPLLTCVKIDSNHQNLYTVKSAYQELSHICN